MQAQAMDFLLARSPQMRAYHAGHIVLLEHIGDLIALGGVLDGEVQIKLLADADGGADIVGPVGMDTALHLPAHDGHQSIQLEVGLGSLGGIFLRLEQSIGIILGIIEGLAQQSGCTHTGHGHLILSAIDALGILAQSELHLLSTGDDHFLGGMAPQLIDNAGAAAHIGRTRQSANGGKAGVTHLFNGIITGVDGVRGPHLRSDRIAHLVAILAQGRHGVGFVKVGDMGMGVDETRGHPAALHIDDFRIGGNGHIGSHGGDFSLFHQHGTVFIGLAGDCHNFSVGNRNHFAKSPSHCFLWSRPKAMIPKYQSKGATSRRSPAFTLSGRGRLWYSSLVRRRLFS